MKTIVGFDGTRMEGATREERVEKIKTYLAQWMQKGNKIIWHYRTIPGDEGKPDEAVVINSVGELTDACATVKAEG